MTTHDNHPPAAGEARVGKDVGRAAPSAAGKEPESPPRNGLASAETRSAAALPWWVGAIPIVVLFVWQVGLVLSYAHLPWASQPGWIRWLGDKPEQGQMTHFWFAALSLIAVAIYVVLRRFGYWERPLVGRVTAVLLGVLVFGAGARYFVNKPALSRSWTHGHDSFHYLLGPKYYPEMGYDLLYACSVEKSAPKDINGNTEVRDLRNYATLSAKEIRERGECAAALTGPRADEFQRDLAVFQGDNLLGRRLGVAIVDHGYNGTPLHTLVAGSVARMVPLNYTSLARLQLIDATAICTMLVVVCWAFGWRYGLLFALMVFTLAADRWSLIGSSYFRYVWLCSLIAGLAALQKEKWGLAGVLLTTSALLNVFPVLFMGGAGVALLGESYRAKAPTPALKRYTAAVAGSLLVLGLLGAAHGHGPRNYGEFADKMQMHLDDPPNKQGGRVERLPGFAIGLKMAFNYRGEHGLRKSPRIVKVGERSRQLREIKWLITGTGLLLFAWALALGLQLSALEAAVLIGFTGMFSVMTVLGYYFASASAIVLMLHRRSRDPGGGILLVLFFAINAIGLYYYAQTANKFGLYNGVLTFSWLGFLLATLVYYSGQVGLGRRMGALVAESAPQASLGPAPASDARS